MNKAASQIYARFDRTETEKYQGGTQVEYAMQDKMISAPTGRLTLLAVIEDGNPQKEQLDCM